MEGKPTEEFSMKMMETKSYIRLTEEGEPQLVCVEPAVDEWGMIDPSMVSVRVDEEEPIVLPRFAIVAMLSVSGCVPLEEVTHWKHTRVH
jgi:hypothetical protein